jgi:hypothetical protein
MSEHTPRAGTPEYFDYLLDSLEAEVRLSEYYDIELESINFYKGMLRAAYQRAMERKEGDAGHAAES